METRQVAAKTGLETLKAKAAEREEANQKKIEEIQTQLEKLRKQKKLSPFLKAFKWIGIVVGAISAAVIGVIGVVTANPLLVAGAAVMAAMTINSIVDEATEGKYSIRAGVAALAKECGASEEDAPLIGIIVEFSITIIGVGLTLVGGGAGGVASAAGIVSGVTTAAQGTLSIVHASYEKSIADSRAAQKDVEAILVRIAEAQDIETRFLESVMKRAEELLASVREIVQGNTEAQTVILAGQPPAVA
jgi:hypothetical protein